MAGADAFTSNGTCYYGAGKKADPAYIPCGNAVFGTVPCCQAGDYCLSNNACFNNQCQSSTIYSFSPVHF